MKHWSWSVTLCAIFAVAIVAAVAAATLPDDPYMRFSTLDKTIQSRVRWIYERVWFDPAPIDVAIVGPSRSEAGIAAPRLEADLAALGHPLRAVNFSLPENGRDLNWVIIQQLLATKHPRLVIIGVIEKPSRFGHPAFKYVASAADVVDPAYFGNLNYLGNLIYLPYRQMRLTAARLVPEAFDLPARFEPALYLGTNDDTTVSFRAHDGHLIDRDHRVSQPDLAAQVVAYERGVSPPIFGAAGHDIEFGDDRVYIARMALLARDHGAKVAFLFLPYYTGPSKIQERGYYEKFGPIIDASVVSHHDEWYSDYGHLNHKGAQFLTDWLAPQVAELVSDTR